MKEFYIGQEVCWYHGMKCLRIGTVVEVAPEKVKLSGVTKEYWVSKKTLSKNVSKPEVTHANMFWG